MSEALAGGLVLLLEIYLVVGLAVAVPFVWWGAGRVDPAAVEGSWGFRLAILPASVALWPWVLVRWVRGAPRGERNAHRAAASTREGG